MSDPETIILLILCIFAVIVMFLIPRGRELPPEPKEPVNNVYVDPRKV